ncbi:MAG: hypothetical protein EOM19_03470 [Candidatus Moranbacteria bacterium]|nr:hypothetical protein [Candidatus Moranbacteria bacterium]
MSTKKSFSRKKSIFFLFCIVFVGLGFSSTFIFAGEYDYLRYSHILIEEDIVWSESFIQEDFSKNIAIVNNATLTIEAGTKVEIGEISVFDGRIVAQGKKGNPIYITKIEPLPLTEEEKQYDPQCFPFNEASGAINFYDEPTSSQDEEASLFSFVVFQDMGTSIHHSGIGCPFDLVKNTSPPFFISSAWASPPVHRDIPAIGFFDGRIFMENVSFQNSAFVDVQVDIYPYSDNEEDDDQVFTFLSIKESNFGKTSSNKALLSMSELSNSYQRGFYERIRLIHNWYGSEDGPKTSENTEAEGKELVGGYVLDGWSEESFEIEVCPECASNIFFLPGIKASNLFMKKEKKEDTLWLPTVGSDDIENLTLDTEGKSKENIYTDTIIESVLGGNIYKTFLERLAKWEEDAIIGDFEIFAYDWRKNVEDIVKNGSSYSQEDMKQLVEEIELLSQSSFTKKVSIVAHSNGGLLAKALIQELERQEKEHLIEKLILVGSPQIGTPLSILSLLYGYEEFIPFLLSSADARDLARNMPGAYGLLPSQAYFDRMEESFISFSSENTRYKNFREAYGENIDSYEEFLSFLSGKKDDRKQPEKNDIEKEVLLRENLLGQGRDTHSRLDVWNPPENITVIQIAGWGLETIQGIEYTEKEKVRCYPSLGSSLPSCIGRGEYEPVYEPLWTRDGDKVVVTPSALFLQESENVKRYWVNLYKEGKGFRKDRSHKNLFEASPVLMFLTNTLQKLPDAELPEFIKTQRPDDFAEDSSRIRVSLYSPLDIHLYDTERRHTGISKVIYDGQEIPFIEENIPQSSYFQLGERKYLHFSGGEEYTLELAGYEEGTYSLILEEMDGEDIIASKHFTHLPTSDKTTVSLTIPSSGIRTLDTIVSDYNGKEIGGEHIAYDGGGISGNTKFFFYEETRRSCFWGTKRFFDIHTRKGE